MQVRRALVSGLFPHAARRLHSGSYRVIATGLEVKLHPSSVLHGKAAHGADPAEPTAAGGGAAPTPGSAGADFAPEEDENGCAADEFLDQDAHHKLPHTTKVRVHRLLDGGCWDNFQYVPPHFDVELAAGEGMDSVGDKIADAARWNSGAVAAMGGSDFLKSYSLFAPLGDEGDLFGFAKGDSHGEHAVESVFDPEILGVELFLEPVHAGSGGEPLPSLSFPRGPLKRRLREEMRHAASCEHEECEGDLGEHPGFFFAPS